MQIDISKLEEEIQQVEQMLEKATSELQKFEIVQDLNTLYKIYGTLMNEKYCIDLPENLSNIQKMVYAQQIKNFVQQMNDMYLYHQTTSKNILQMYNNAKFQEFNLAKLTTFTPNQALDIIYNFFNWCNPTYYRLVKEMFENHQVGLCSLENFGGLCCDVVQLKKSYILCDNVEFDLYSISLLVHEFGHAINYELFRNANLKQIINQLFGNYQEVPSIFFQKLFLDYTLMNKIGDGEAIFALNRLYTDMLIDFMRIRFFTHPEMGKEKMVGYTHIEPETSKRVIRNLTDEINDTNIVVNRMHSSFNIKEAIMFGYGTLLAIHFVEQYKQDPKEALNNLKSFIIMTGFNNGYEILNTCGLKDNEIANSKVLKKELSIHMNIMKKIEELL